MILNYEKTVNFDGNDIILEIGMNLPPTRPNCFKTLGVEYNLIGMERNKLNRHIDFMVQRVVMTSGKLININTYFYSLKDIQQYKYLDETITIVADSYSDHISNNYSNAIRYYSIRGTSTI